MSKINTVIKPKYTYLIAHSKTRHACAVQTLKTLKMLYQHFLFTYCLLFVLLPPQVKHFQAAIDLKKTDTTLSLKQFLANVTE